MKGSIKKRGSSWRGRADLGIDPETGKRKVVSVTTRTKKEAGDELRRRLEKHERREYVPPDRLTLGQWLDTWIASYIEPTCRPRTLETYRSVVEQHLRPHLGALRLQTLEAEHLEQYFAERRGTLSAGTLAQHSVILHGALKSAVKKKKIPSNPALLVENRPQRTKTKNQEADEQSWEADEARRFLEAARKAGPQQAAFYTMALELGLRKGELCGLRWKEINLEEGTVTISRQLVRVGSGKTNREPLFGPPKNGRTRKLDISQGLVSLLAAHRKHQAEVKIKNRLAYRDYGLVFAKEGRGTSSDRIGEPLQANNIAEREFNGLVEKAEVRRVKFHGLRHTSATLALQHGTPIKVVQERLGHQKTETTLDIYTHALPSAHRDAAAMMGKLLHE